MLEDQLHSISGFNSGLQVRVLPVSTNPFQFELPSAQPSGVKSPKFAEAFPAR